jgi:hypothetical protein
MQEPHNLSHILTSPSGKVCFLEAKRTAPCVARAKPSACLSRRGASMDHKVAFLIDGSQSRFSNGAKAPLLVL